MHQIPKGSFVRISLENEYGEMSETSEVSAPTCRHSNCLYLMQNNLKIT